ncbi:MAG TPA: glycosyltransferase family 1 protein [Chthoniobacterales bacterium]|jgi:glycosyltransferase involved in cell wall biosynthesis
MVLLIGNYPPDQQQSMDRFAALLRRGLSAAGIEVELIRPEPFFGNFQLAGKFIAKWLGYIDKFILFPPQLRKKIAERPALVHICDHSNAMYAKRAGAVPVVVTCHDLLAVRGALGEDTDCPASWTGKILQRWILRSLRRARTIACVSRATCADAERFLGSGGEPKLEVITLGLNYPYRKLPAPEVIARLKRIRALDSTRPFVLHVGSNERRKNRDGVLRIFARTKDKWNGQVVFAGDPLPLRIHSLGRKLGVSSRLVEVVFPESELLETLYNGATALVYPSRSEGFGWPAAEAHACGCPVISSDVGPLPEVCGDAALMHPLEDEAAFAADILRLTDPAERQLWSDKALRNATRFDAGRMIAQYLGIYRALAPQL